MTHEAATGLRTFVHPASLGPEGLDARGADARRLVARGARPGDVIEALDGSGWSYLVHLLTADAERCAGPTLARHLAPARRTKISLYHGLLDAADMRRMVAHATAAGVVALHPTICGGSVVPLVATDDADADWAALARDSAEAAGRGHVPLVAPPAMFDHALDEAVRLGRDRFVLDPEGEAPAEALAARPFSVALFHPPGARFTAEERDLASARGARALRIDAATSGADPVRRALDALEAVYAALEPAG